MTILATGNTARGSKRSSGLSIIEVMLAVALLSIGIIVILYSYSSSLDALRQGQDTLNALACIEEKTSDFIFQAYSDKGVPQGTTTAENDTCCPNLKWTVQISPGPVATLNEMLVSVISKRTDRKYQLIGYIANKETEG